MGNQVLSTETVQTLTVNKRVMQIDRTAWKNTDGLSFDVTDVATGQCLTVESFDEWPSAGTIENLLEQLAEDRVNGTLDPFFDGTPIALIVCAHEDQYVSDDDFTFRCRDCGTNLGR
ncbi:MAG: hypothetical protein ABWZ30_00985 [Jiangellaceae bacterium]